MAKFDVVDLDLKKVAEIELSDAIFGAEPNDNLLYEVAKMQQINRRRGTVGVKNSSLVSGGGKAMAPKSRDYTYRPPKKVRRGALKAALSLKAREKTLIILDKFELDGAKSKQAFEALTKRLKLENALVVDAKTNEKLHRSIRNLAKFDVLPPEGLNLESVLRHKSLVLTSQAAKALEGSLS